MKKITCYDCEEVFESETSKGILDQMYPHYMEKHTAIISGANEKEKKAWMEKFNKDWEMAPKE